MIADKPLKKAPQDDQGRWQFLCRFKDGSCQWINLYELKESYPVDVAVYARVKEIDHKPAFKWWVPHTLRKMSSIVKSVKASMAKKNMKYGIKVPRMYAQACKFDIKENNGGLWEKAYRKEMKNVGIAFEILDEGARAPVGWKKSSVHLAFDEKMTGKRKARMVKDGHRTPDPETSSYAGIVSCESVRITLTYAALHNISVCAADICNAYFSALSSEKHYVICGPEFGSQHEGCVALISCALYRGKAAGRDYWHYLRKVMHDKLGFEGSRGDPDVWFSESRRTSNNSRYYNYVLIYTDDILVLSDRAESVLRNKIGSGPDSFELKPELIIPPSQYFGGKLSLITLADGTKAWSFSSGQYICKACDNVKRYLKTVEKKLPARAGTPMSKEYCPEIDVTPVLTPSQYAYYQSLIGMLRWMVKLGQVDICLEVSMLSSHLAMPREGHLEQVLHIFGYLDKHSNAPMVLNPTPWEVPEDKFAKQDWNYSIYGCKGMKEELPPDMPTPLGESMHLQVYVDSDHAGDQVTRCSRTGFMIYLNNAPIYWFSKR